MDQLEIKDQMIHIQIGMYTYNMPLTEEYLDFAIKNIEMLKQTLFGYEKRLKKELEKITQESKNTLEEIKQETTEPHKNKQYPIHNTELNKNSSITCPKCYKETFPVLTTYIKNRRTEYVLSFVCFHCHYEWVPLKKIEFEYDEEVPEDPTEELSVEVSNTSSKNEISDEAKQFMQSLHKYTKTLKPNHEIKKGRPIKNLRSSIFCVVLYNYAELSSRKLIDLTKYAKEKKYITYVPHFNTILNYFEEESINKGLKQVIPRLNEGLKQTHKNKDALKQQTTQLAKILKSMILKPIIENKEEIN